MDARARKKQYWNTAQCECFLSFIRSLNSHGRDCYGLVIDSELRFNILQQKHEKKIKKKGNKCVYQKESCS